MTGRARMAAPAGLRIVAVTTVCMLLAACAAPTPHREYGYYRNLKAASPAPGRYRVWAGDTLYSIAFRHGLDVRQLAAINQIGPPYTIYPGQILRFAGSAEGEASRVPGPTSPADSLTPPSASETASVAAAQRIQWHWPLAGDLAREFGVGDPPTKGIDIAAPAGTAVRAAAAGEVVYAGDGLRAYGNLVIIKHSDDFISAYGHNRKLLVKETEKIKVGQVIAETGREASGRGRLHFEIRHRGIPMNPLGLLPRKN